jgi:uncharacterized membrane protein YbhN (UPF0104 family)
VGPFEAAVLLALSAFGIGGPQALAMALLYHLVQLVPVTVVGIEGLRFVGEARRAAARAGDGGPAGCSPTATPRD